MQCEIIIRSQKTQMHIKLSIIHKKKSHIVEAECVHIYIYMSIVTCAFCHSIVCVYIHTCICI